MALRKFLILRRPQSGRLEGRAMPIQHFRGFPHSLFRRNDNRGGEGWHCRENQGSPLSRRTFHVISATSIKGMSDMLAYVMVGSSNLKRSAKFYDAARSEERRVGKE